jgi:hypothetical protein
MAPMSTTLLASAVVAAALATTGAVMTPIMRDFRERSLGRMRQRVAQAHGAVALPPDQYYNQTLDHFE